MPESLVSDRIIFSSKESQSAFLRAIKDSRKMSWKDIAAGWKVNIRTVSSWKSGENSMPYDLALSAAEAAGITLPEGSRRQAWSEHAAKAGRKGAKSNLRKNGRIGGDEENRKEKWREWWDSEGKQKKIAILEQKDIRIPPQGEELAEFIGIMLGDGGITPYHIAISLNKNESGYAQFIRELIKSLFGTDPKSYFRKDCAGLDIVVQRKRLVTFLNSLGLPIGSKIRQGADVPEWVMENLRFQKACIRGLMDTDGCFFIHSYISHGKRYEYLKIDFTSVSKPLLLSARKILINLGFNVRICRNGKAVRIESQQDVRKYIETVGTHNSRYERKLAEFEARKNNS